MTKPVYDEIDRYYAEFVHRELQVSDSHFSLRTNEIFQLLGDIKNKQICDLACGEGYLSRMMAKRGGIVTAVDISSALLHQARNNSPNLSINFLIDDALLHPCFETPFTSTGSFRPVLQLRRLSNQCCRRQLQQSRLLPNGIKKFHAV